MEEYLVHGHFDQRDVRDRLGHDTTVWMPLEQLFLDLQTDAAALDAALVKWELTCAERRLQRLRELREQHGELL